MQVFFVLKYDASNAKKRRRRREKGPFSQNCIEAKVCSGGNGKQKTEEEEEEKEED